MAEELDTNLPIDETVDQEVVPVFEGINPEIPSFDESSSVEGVIQFKRTDTDTTKPPKWTREFLKKQIIYKPNISSANKIVSGKEFLRKYSNIDFNKIVNDPESVSPEMARDYINLLNPYRTRLAAGWNEYVKNGSSSILDSLYEENPILFQELKKFEITTSSRPKTKPEEQKWVDVTSGVAPRTEYEVKSTDYKDYLPEKGLWAYQVVAQDPYTAWLNEFPEYSNLYTDEDFLYKGVDEIYQRRFGINKREYEQLYGDKLMAKDKLPNDAMTPAEVSEYFRANPNLLKNKTPEQINQIKERLFRGADIKNDVFADVPDYDFWKQVQMGVDPRKLTRKSTFSRRYNEEKNIWEKRIENFKLTSSDEKIADLKTGRLEKIALDKYVYYEPVTDPKEVYALNKRYGKQASTSSKLDIKSDYNGEYYIDGNTGQWKYRERGKKDFVFIDNIKQIKDLNSKYGLNAKIPTKEVLDKQRKEEDLLFKYGVDIDDLLKNAPQHASTTLGFSDVDDENSTLRIDNLGKLNQKLKPYGVRLKYKTADISDATLGLTNILGITDNQLEVTFERNGNVVHKESFVYDSPNLSKDVYNLLKAWNPSKVNAAFDLQMKRPDASINQETWYNYYSRLSDKNKDRFMKLSDTEKELEASSAYYLSPTKEEYEQQKWYEQLASIDDTYFKKPDETKAEILAKSLSPEKTKLEEYAIQGIIPTAIQASKEQEAIKNYVDVVQNWAIEDITSTEPSNNKFFPTDNKTTQLVNNEVKKIGKSGQELELEIKKFQEKFRLFDDYKKESEIVNSRLSQISKDIDQLKSEYNAYESEKQIVQNKLQALNKRYENKEISQSSYSKQFNDIKSNFESNWSFINDEYIQSLSEREKELTLEYNKIKSDFDNKYSDINQEYLDNLSREGSDISTKITINKFENASLNSALNDINRAVSIKNAELFQRGNLITGSVYTALTGFLKGFSLLSDQSSEDIQKTVSELLGPSIAPEYLSEKNLNWIEQAYYGVLGTYATGVGGAIAGAPAGPVGSAIGMGIALYSSNYVDFMETADQIAPDIPHYKKQLLGGLYGITAGALDRIGIGAVLPSLAKKNLIFSIMKNTIDGIPKNASKEAIEKIIQGNIKYQVIQGGLSLSYGSLGEGLTGALQEVDRRLVNEILDKATDNEYFNNEGAKAITYDVLKNGALEALGGGLMDVAVNTSIAIKDKISLKASNERAESMVSLARQKDFYSQLSTALQVKIQKKELSLEQAKEIQKNWKRFSDKISLVPENLNAKNTIDVVNLMIEKDVINQEISGKDPLLTLPQQARIKEIDEQIKTIGNAVQEPSTEGVLQRQQEGVTETGGERGGVEPIVQGQEVAQEGEKNRQKDEIERRRQEELKPYNERDYRSLEAVTPNNPNHPTIKVGMKSSDGLKVIVEKTNTDNWNGEGEGYTIITAVRSPAEFDSNGKMTKAAKIEEAVFNSKEEAEAAVQATFEKVKSLAGKKQKEINAKYDAELAALEVAQEGEVTAETKAEEVVPVAPTPVPGEKATIADVDIIYPTEPQAEERRGVRSTNEYVEKASESLPVEDVETLAKELEGDFGLLTAENPMAQPLTEEENQKLNEKAVEWLSERGYNPRPVTGKYGQAENSFFVPGLKRQDAIDFAKQFNQEAVAHSDGLVYQDGSMNPRVKENDNFSFKDSYTPDSDFVSIVKTPEGLKTFVVGYNFDEKVMPEQQAAATQVAPEVTITPETNQTVTERINKETDTKRKKVFTAVQKVLSAIPNARIILHENTDSFVDGVAKSSNKTKEDAKNEGVDTIRGAYVNGDIHINLEKAGVTTVFHEALHDLLTKKGIETNAILDMAKGLKSVISDKALKQRLDEFVSEYTEEIDQNKSKEEIEEAKKEEELTKAEEYMVELGAIMAEAQKELSTTKLQQFKNFINKIAKKLGLPTIFSAASTAQDAVDFINSMAGKLGKGEQIEVGEYVENPIGVIKAEKTFGSEKNKITVVYAEQDKIDELIKKGLLEQVDNIHDIGEVFAATTSPDDMLAGAIFLNDKKIADGYGGIYFVTMFNDVWASSNEKIADQIAKRINKSLRDNPNNKGYLFLVKGSDAKLISSPQGATSSLKVLESMVQDGLISASDFRSAINQSMKDNPDTKAKINLQGNMSLSDMIMAVDSLFDDVKKSSFDNRGTILKSIIINLGNTESVKKNDAKIKEFLRVDKNNKLGWSKTSKTLKTTSSVLDLIANISREDITRGLNNGDIYAAIEVNGEVEVKPGDHKSYPFHIKTKDGSSPKLILFKNRKHGRDVLSSENNETSEELGASFDGKVLGTASNGFGYGKVREQQPSKIKAQIIGKNANLSQNVRDNLQVARDMEVAGKSVKDIQIATGWERGTDKKWRYEIDDNILILKSRLLDQLNNIEKPKTYGELSRIDINKIINDELIKLYPELSNTEIVINPTISYGEGYYIPSLNQIHISNNNVYLNNTASVLLHEIQHVIQNIEGFSVGSDINKVTDSVGEKLINEIESGDDAIVYNKLQSIISKMQEDPLNRKKLESGMSKIQTLLDNYSNKKYGKKVNAYAFDVYRRYAGEVEARNVEKRMNMTPEERRQTTLQETEDVSREDQIIFFGEEGKPSKIKAQKENTRQNAIDDAKAKYDLSVTRRRNPHQQGVDAALNDLRKSDWYKSSDDTQRENAERELKKFFGEKLKSAPSVEKVLGKKPQPATFSVSDLGKALRDQLKNAAKIAREAKKAIYDSRKSLNESVKEVLRSYKGKISLAQARAILNKSNTLNLLSPEKINQFINYVERVAQNANYAEKVNKAEQTKRKIRRNLKNAQAENKMLAKNFLKIDPLMVEDIDDYNSMADSILGSIAPSRIVKGKPQLKTPVEIASLNDNINYMLYKQEESMKKSMMSSYRDLVDYGVISGDMTYAEMQDVINKIKQDVFVEGYNEDDVNKLLDSMFNDKVIEISEMGATDPNGIISRIQKANIDGMSIKDKAKLVEMLDNFLVNFAVGGLDSVLEVIEGNNQAKNIYNSGKKATPIKYFFSKTLGNLRSIGLVTAPEMFNLVFNGVVAATKVMDRAGFGKVILGANKARNTKNALENEYAEKFGKQKNFWNIDNTIERGMVAFLARFDKQENMQSELNRRVEMINSAIETLKKGTKEEQKLAKTYQLVADRLNINSVDRETIFNNAKTMNKDAVGWMMDKWADIYGDLSFVSLSVYNTMLSKDQYYTTDRYKKTEMASSITGAEEIPISRSSYVMNSDTLINKTETGVLMPNTKPSPSTIKSQGRYIDLSFEMNNFSAMEGALVDIETAAAIRRVDAFMNSKYLSKVITDPKDLDIIKGKVSKYIASIKNRSVISNKQYQKVLRDIQKKIGLNFLGKIGYSLGLGSAFQPIQQTVPVTLSTAIQTGLTSFVDLFRTDSKFQQWLNKSGAGVSNRGQEAVTAIESADSKIKTFENYTDKISDGISKFFNLKLKYLLSKPDIWVARGAFLSYYKQYLEMNNIDSSKINWDTWDQEIKDNKLEDINKEAILYADNMVNRNQNVSDERLAGELLSSQDEVMKIIRKTLFPYASFSINSRAKIATDVATIYNWKRVSSEDRSIALKSLIGTLVEQAAFHGLNLGRLFLLGTIASLIYGDDDDETEEEREKRKKNASKFPVKSFMGDLVSPAPVLDKTLVNVFDMFSDYLSVTEKEVNDAVNKENERRALNYIGNAESKFKMNPEEERKFREKYLRDHSYKLGTDYPGAKDSDRYGLFSVAYDQWERFVDRYEMATTGEYIVTDQFGNTTKKYLGDQDKNLVKLVYFIGDLPAIIGGSFKEGSQISNKIYKKIEENSYTYEQYGVYKEFKKRYKREPQAWESMLIRENINFLPTEQSKKSITEVVDYIKDSGGFTNKEGKEFVKALVKITESYDWNQYYKMIKSGKKYEDLLNYSLKIRKEEIKKQEEEMEKLKQLEIQQQKLMENFVPPPI